MTYHLAGRKPGSAVKARTAARGTCLRFKGRERWSKVAISDRTVAIIGTGTIAGILAAEFAAGGQD